jgi:hypothetical protein
MPSYTSSSEDGAAGYGRATKLLLASLVLLCLFFELGTRYALHRVSRIQDRIRTEKLTFLSTRLPDSAGIRSVVILGNSLLLWSLEISFLNRLGSGNFHYSRFAMENTKYWDWYFGLRSLFAKGARPAVVALLIGTNHWVEDSVAGEVFAHELLQPFDVNRLRGQLNLDRTTASTYFFASASAWLGGRAAIRKNLIRLIFPDFEQFAHKLLAPPAYPPEEIAYAKAIARMRDLAALCRSYGVELVIILHPTLNSHEPFNLIRNAARAAGVPVIAPVHTEYSSLLFADGYHLNQAGMEKFTRAVLPPLEDRLSSFDQRNAARP